jgi:adenylate cyclase
MSQTRRLAAILAADVAGFSRLIGADEEGTLNRLRSMRTEVIDPRIIEYRGRIVKTTGDGLLVEFSSVIDALRCATEWQLEIADRNPGTPDDRIEFRIGVHQGDIVVEDNDIFGDGVNVAARLEGLANPGGICVSARVQEDVTGRLNLTFDDLGEQTLKNIARPVRVYRVRLATAENTPKVTPTQAAPALALPDKPSIAVLPFANMSGDPEQEYFADGMVEEIITGLSRIRWLFVIARNSSFTYKGRSVDVKQVGLELGVRYVIEGSVRKAGNRVRITAQLVEAGTGNHIWAERYDRELADIFTVQDEITERVLATIEPELYAAEQFRSQSKPPESLSAWECVMRAMSLVSQSKGAANAEAEELCRRAIAIAPNYGQAHALLAFALERRPIWSGDTKAILLEASAAARRALDLDERDSWAHMAHGMALWRMRCHGEAERAFRRALELNPNFALAHALLGMVLAAEEVHVEAVQIAQRALRLSPIDRLIDIYASLAISIAHFAASRYAESAAWARGIAERHPDYDTAYLMLAAAAAMHGDIEVAVKARATLLDRRPQFSLAWMHNNNPLTGDMLDRVVDGLRRAGIPGQ